MPSLPARYLCMCLCSCPIFGSGRMMPARFSDEGDVPVLLTLPLCTKLLKDGSWAFASAAYHSLQYPGYMGPSSSRGDFGFSSWCKKRQSEPRLHCPFCQSWHTRLPRLGSSDRVFPRSCSFDLSSLHREFGEGRRSPPAPVLRVSPKGEGRRTPEAAALELRSV